MKAQKPPTRIFHDSTKCELSSKWEKRRIPPCRGEVKKVGVVGLCARHREILDEIVADANALKARLDHGVAA